MKSLLEQFWKWIDLTPLQYAQTHLDQKSGVYEDQFPYMENLRSYAKEIVDKGILTNECLDDLLTIMAIDNESEDTLDYITKNGSDKQIEKIARIGTTHLQPHARWQTAELICRRNLNNCMDLLLILSNDEDQYVKKRAVNCINALN